MRATSTTQAPFMLQSRTSRIVLVIVALLVLVMAFGPSPGRRGAKEGAQNGTYISYSDFSRRLNDEKFVSVSQKLGTMMIVATGKDGAVVHTLIPPGSPLIEEAREAGLDITIAQPDQPSLFPSLFSILIMLLPVALLIGFMYWMMRKQSENQGMPRGPQMLTKKEWVDPRSNPHRLADVAGCDEAKAEVAEIVEFLRNPEMYERVGARAPKGILMDGPPGTGKTLLAKSIAGEAGVPFFSASGSDFVEMYVGVGAARVRALFEQAKKVAPSIIFIDEIDAVARQRSSGMSGGHEEREQTLNAMLVEMDGFAPNTNVVVIAATNRADILDQAITRPGRFDREVTLSLPDRAGRAAILAVHGKSVPIALDVDWLDIARGTPGFSGADLANLVNEAALLAARTKQNLVTRAHFAEARDKIIMGVQRSPMKNKDEREIVAYHEAGHAIIAHVLPHCAPVHKISIVPRGRALGVTVQLPEEDSYNHSRDKLLGDITVLMGGRAAEAVALNQSTVGASNDFMRATVMARRMVASWGMDPEFGPISVDGERGNDWAGSGVWSEDIKKRVDARVQDILRSHYAQAVSILTSYRAALEEVAQALLEQETLEAEGFGVLMAKHHVPQGPADPVVLPAPTALDTDAFGFPNPAVPPVATPSPETSRPGWKRTPRTA